ncbi:MAG: benzoate-CoA ligase family protein [Armatimonadota bacterium]|nr:benzoate-CoA ligase family protein [Armatimonadota bacterium]
MSEVLRQDVAPNVHIPEVFNVATIMVDRHLAEGRGGKVAIYYEDQEITYADVLAFVNRTGNALRDLGVQIEDRVLLLLLDCPEFVYSFFGAIKIGAVPIPTNTLLKPADYEYMLNDSRAVVAIVSEALLPQIQAIPRERLRYLRHLLVVGNAPSGTLSFTDLLERASPELEPEPTHKDDAAFWLYSSGTTGFPKGCVHLHHDMVYCAEYYAKGILGIHEYDRTYSVAKLFFAYGLGNALYFPFYVGASTILFPGPPTPANVYWVIERYRPTLFFSVPTNYAMLLAQEGNYDLSSIRLAVSAGEALPPAIYQRFLERFGIRILDGIGSTEVLHIFISNRPDDVRPGSSGKVVPGYEVKIVDEEGRPVPVGEIGDLWVKGDSTCAFYWNKHEKTKETIQGHWIRTGDKYWQDSDGYYWYAGRSDDMLKVGGMWVSPVEVENCLMEHEKVLEAAVIGRPDQDGLIKPHAYIVLRPGYEPSEALAEELKEFVRGRIAAYKRPRWIEFVDQLPKTATGKTQRFKLRELASKRSGERT